MGIDKLVEQIEHQRNILHHSRAFFPHILQNMVGEKLLSPPEYYRKRGYNIQLFFSQGITLDEIQMIGDIGYWINQSFVIRFCALIESYGIKLNSNELDNSLPGYKETDLLYRLRNKFAHSKGFFNPKKKKNQDLYEEIIKHFSLSREKYPGKEGGQYPIPIDTVLDPLIDGVIAYVRAKLESNYS